MANLIKDIKYDGSSDYILWKSPIVDFETGSVLTVSEAQTALFYLNGECVGQLSAGKHILETENIPFLNKLFEAVSGGENIFHSQIYFVNNMEFFSMKWGVGDITYQDTSGIVFKIGCNGEINLNCANPRFIVEKVAGMKDYMSKEELVDKFRGLIGSEVTDVLVNTIVENKIPIISISAYLKKISENVKPYIEKLFEEYGINVPQFRIIKVLLPEDDPQFKRLKNLRADEGILLSELEIKKQADILRAQTKAQAELVSAQAQAQKIKLEADALAFKRQTEGYTYQQERQFDVMQGAVENNSGGNVSGVTGEFMSLGAGLGVMGTVSNMMKDNFNAMSKAGIDITAAKELVKCPECGEMLSKDAKFCLKCGAKVSKNIICPECGKETPEGKFCINCGFKLISEHKKCSDCSTEVDENAVFCPNCGKKFS